MEKGTKWYQTVYKEVQKGTKLYKNGAKRYQKVQRVQKDTKKYENAEGAIEYKFEYHFIIIGKMRYFFRFSPTVFGFSVVTNNM